jgi:dimethylhistidine N-methyltransferase
MTIRAWSVAAGAPEWLVSDVRHHLTLTPRELPSRALYDELGSALFEAICWLPWYPVTRAECRLIDAHGAQILDGAGTPERLVELGCGSGDKLNRLLHAASAGGHASEFRGRIDLVDVSPAALASAVRVLGEHPGAMLVTHAQRYEAGLEAAVASRRQYDRLCVLLLGSNIGNFDPPAAEALLGGIRSHLCPLDTLLIGADLVKPEDMLLLAYDDPLGVTAAFNRNLLVRLNRELGATFDVDGFGHRAVWNGKASRMEMHLVSRRRQHVEIPGAGLSIDFQDGETIWTESSYKYTVPSISATLERAGFEPVRRWLDEEGQFLLTLALARDR